MHRLILEEKIINELGSACMKVQYENKPLQNDELFTIWSHLGSNNGDIAANQFFYNLANDSTLRNIINDFTTCLKDENKHLESLLKRKGITLLPSFIVHSETRNKEIPFRTNSTDTEIYAALTMNIATSLVTTSKALGQSTCEYTLLMYGHFHMKKAVLGAQLLQR